VPRLSKNSRQAEVNLPIFKNLGKNNSSRGPGGCLPHYEFPGHCRRLDQLFEKVLRKRSAFVSNCWAPGLSIASFRSSRICQDLLCGVHRVSDKNRRTLSQACQSGIQAFACCLMKELSQRIPPSAMKRPDPDYAAPKADSGEVVDDEAAFSDAPSSLVNNEETVARRTTHLSLRPICLPPVQFGSALLDAFNQKLAFDNFKEKQIDRLHEELQAYKSDLLLKATQPLIAAMIKLHATSAVSSARSRGRSNQADG